MEGKPNHYDGSFHKSENSLDQSNNEVFKLTDEMSGSISGNPFSGGDQE
ncbi:hypothetical protein [Alkalihalobacterium sp. APHAB7]